MREGSENSAAMAVARLSRRARHRPLIIKARQFISLAVNAVLYCSLHVSFLPEVGYASVSLPRLDVIG